MFLRSAKAKHPPELLSEPVFNPMKPSLPSMPSKVTTVPATGRSTDRRATIRANTGSVMALSAMTVWSAAVDTVLAATPLGSV